MQTLNKNFLKHRPLTRKELHKLGNDVGVKVTDKDPDDHSDCILYSHDGKTPLL